MGTTAPSGGADAPSGTSAPSQQTDTLLVRQLGEATEKELFEAFSKIAPRIRSVKVPKTFAGRPKGHGFVTFHEVHEAEAALRHFRSDVGEVNGRRVTVEFAPMESFEDKMEQEAKRKSSDANVKTSHAAALKGPNADMWASYMAMFEDGGPLGSGKDAGSSEDNEGTGEAQPPLPTSEELSVHGEMGEIEEPDTKRSRTEAFDAPSAPPAWQPAALPGPGALAMSTPKAPGGPPTLGQGTGAGVGLGPTLGLGGFSMPTPGAGSTASSGGLAPSNSTAPSPGTNGPLGMPPPSLPGVPGLPGMPGMSPSTLAGQTAPGGLPPPGGTVPPRPMGGGFPGFPPGLAPQRMPMAF